MENYVEINSCRICGNKNLDVVLDLGMHALAGRFPSKNESDPITAPLVLVRCNDEGEHNKENCGLLQLKHAVKSDELYQHNYGYFSGINKTMKDHLKTIVEEIEKKGILKEGDTVLDIGSNDATMLKFFSSSLKRLGIDPTGEQFRDKYPPEIILASSLFDAKTFKSISNKKAKAITSIACFYDLPDPNIFVEDVKECLDEEGLWVFEQSYMPLMLKTKSIDTICSEHLEYYSIKAIKYLLDKHEMKIINIDFNNTNGGSFKITAAHKNSTHVECSKEIQDCIDIEKSMGLITSVPYTKFEMDCHVMKDELNSFIKEQKAIGKSIYILGASTKGNTLLQYYGIDNNLITAAAERNSEKVGRRTPATNIPIISEEEARESNPDFFIVLPWHFKDEIIEREKDYLNNGGKLIFPLPKFEVIDKNSKNN